MLTQISFDYTNRSKWDKYDIVLLIEFGLKFDRKYYTIIDMAMHGLEESDSHKIIRNLINENTKNDKKILIIIDGYNDAVSGRCQELDDVLNSSLKELNFDLIVTTKSNIEIDRNDRVTFLKIIGCNMKEKQRYNRQIESRISKILIKPIILVKSIIKELYRNQFGEYHRFYFDLEFQFDMNLWFPIKLVKIKGSDDEQKLFDELICEELSKSGLVVITGT
jgi:hypothetical protein